MSNEANVFTIRGNDGGIIKLETHNALFSTADIARWHAAKGLPDRYVVFTDKRLLESGETESGIYMSVLLRPSIFPSQAPLLGHMAATAMLTALKDHTDTELGIGWVGDLYANGVRIGESSIEGKLDNYTTYEYIIVTYSIKISEANFPPRLTDIIKQVFEDGNSSRMVIMAKNLLVRFFALYSEIKTSSKFMDIYSENFILRGKHVKYIDGQKKRRMRVLSVDVNTGALVLDGPGKKPLFVSSPSNVIIPKRVKIKKKKSSKEKDNGGAEK